MEIEKILKGVGAWHAGHTVFRDGRHGGFWLEKNIIVRNSKYLDRIAELQAKHINNHFSSADMILGPVTGGALIASHVGKYFDREYEVIDAKQLPISYHGMRIPKKGEKVVLVEDIISSGVDMNKFSRFVLDSGADLIGISVWLNRKEDRINSVKVISLLENNFEVYTTDNCPYCRKGDDILFKDVRE